MHEVSLAEGVIDVVERAAEGAHATAVSEVRVAVGELSNVEIEALAFAFESVKKGTVANDAKLVIDRPEGRAWCMTCQKDVPYHRFGDACPICGGLSGSGFRGTRHAGRGYQGDNPRRFG